MTTTIIHTQSGTRYEIDGDAKRIRRLSPGGTERLPSNEWRTFEWISPVVLGKSLTIVWPDAVQPAAAEGTIPGTVTSPVVGLE